MAASDVDCLQISISSYLQTEYCHSMFHQSLKIKCFNGLKLFNYSNYGAQNFILILMDLFVIRFEELRIIFDCIKFN